MTDYKSGMNGNLFYYAVLCQRNAKVLGSRILGIKERLISSPSDVTRVLKEEQVARSKMLINHSLIETGIID